MLQEIRVRFNSCDDHDGDSRFRVQLTDVAGTECGVACDFAPFLTDDDYENLRWYLEEYMDLPDGGAVVRARGIEQHLHQWGRRLYDALFAAPENRALLQQLLDSPEPRELTIATDQSTLLRLPWELLADDAGSLAQRVSVRRQLETPEKTEPRSLPLPLRMLYIVSRPSDTGFIDPRMTTSPHSIRSAATCASISVARPHWPAWRRCSARDRPPDSRTTSSISTDTARSI